MRDMTKKIGSSPAANSWMGQIKGALKAGMEAYD
jgi:hypothetical protein